MSTLKAIRKKCLDCCCNSPKEVELCILTGLAKIPKGRESAGDYPRARYPPGLKKYIDSRRDLSPNPAE
jgi:hypothetical protein